jgi:PhnB protein
VQNPPPGYARVSPYLLCEDAERELEYLARVFGFVERRRETGGAGRLHAEVMVGDDDGLVLVGQAGEGFLSRRSAGGSPTFLLHVYVDDVEALYERARATGAEGLSELEDSPVGDRRFNAEDPEGHWWFFAQRVR